MKRYSLLLILVATALLQFLSSCKKEHDDSAINKPLDGEELLGEPPSTCYYPTVSATTYTGNGNPITIDGNIKVASLAGPRYMCRFGDILYFTQDARVRKIQSSVVSTIYSAGTSAKSISAIAADYDGNLYLSHADFTISKISPTGVVLATYGTPGVSGYSLIAPFRFGAITGLAVDIEGRVYIQDEGNKVILRMNSATSLEKIAGQRGLTGWVDGPVATARLDIMQLGIAVTPYGDKIYFTDDGKVRVISGGTISTIAGNSTRGYVNGNGSVARFGRILSFTIDALENVYVGEITTTPTGSYDGYKVRKVIKMTTGLIPWKVSTLAGNGYGSSIGDFTVTALNHPMGIVVSNDIKNVFVTCYDTHVIRKLALTCLPVF